MFFCLFIIILYLFRRHIRKSGIYNILCAANLISIRICHIDCHIIFRCNVMDQSVFIILIRGQYICNRRRDLLCFPAFDHGVERIQITDLDQP